MRKVNIKINNNNTSNKNKLMREIGCMPKILYSDGTTYTRCAWRCVFACFIACVLWRELCQSVSDLL